MDGMNSRYRRPENTTIRTNTSDSYYGDDMNIMEADNNQKHRQTQRASATRGHSGRGSARARRQSLIYLIIIIVEVVLLIGIWVAFFSMGGKSKSSSKASSNSSSDSASSGGSVNVDNENFSVTCSKVSITTDSNGGPAAVIYFTFVNKTDSALSMSQVFAPSVMQNGATLASSASLVDQPQELVNKDTPISSGQSLDCAFAFTLQDSTSPLTLIMHDNYETFSDIGSTEIPIS